MKRKILKQMLMLSIVLSGIMTLGDGEIKGEDSIEVVSESEVCGVLQFR